MMKKFIVFTIYISEYGSTKPTWSMTDIFDSRGIAEMFITVEMDKGKRNLYNKKDKKCWHIEEVNLPEPQNAQYILTKEEDTI